MGSLTKPAPRRRVRRSREQWRELLARFEQSGQKRNQFCAEQGLSMSSFMQWQRKLREPVAGGANAAEEAVFIELPSDAPGAATPSGPWELELQLGVGVVLRLRRSVC
jgi:hypothetical protein